MGIKTKIKSCYCPVCMSVSFEDWNEVVPPSDLYVVTEVCKKCKLELQKIRVKEILKEKGFK